MFNKIKSITVVIIALIVSTSVFAGNPDIKQIVGSTSVGNVKQSGQYQLPFITWGGDMVTFYANGSIKGTKPGTVFANLGLNFRLKAGDDYAQQVRDYRSGKSPFLRMPLRAAGFISEIISSDARTKGVAIMQLTWSAGDHFVVKNNIKKIADLKGKKIVINGPLGPHVGFLDDVLKTANLSWDDVTIIWAKDLSGTKNSPAEMFRNNSDIAACFVITPDMIGLTGGHKNIGSGAEGTVKGAKILVSTAELSRSIADVYICRKDFFDKNKELVTKFVAGYLKACEEVIALRKAYETNGSTKYTKLLTMTQKIYGKEIIPTLEDAHGLLLDCKFVGYPGNVVYFTEKNNLHGFDAMQNSALDLAKSQGFISVRSGMFASSLDYSSKIFTSNLKNIKVERKERFNAEAVASEIEALNAGGDLEENTLVSFTIQFAANQKDFSTVQYGSEYERVIKLADKYGNAVIAVRGHADTTAVLIQMIRAGFKKGILRKTGSKAAGYKYYMNGKELKLSSIKILAKLIEAGAFDGAGKYNPRATMQAALNLSRKRAEAVRDSIIKYAKEKGITIDKSQIQPIGAGITDPIVAKPRNKADAAANRRVEFSLIKVNAESANDSDFDF